MLLHDVHCNFTNGFFFVAIFQIKNVNIKIKNDNVKCKILNYPISNFKLYFVIFHFDFSILHFHEPERGVEPPTYSLPWSCSASELPGQKIRNQKIVGWEGFAPPKAEPPDLQSGPFDYFGTNPIQSTMIIGRPPIILFPNRFHSSGFYDKKQGFARDCVCVGILECANNKKISNR